MERVRSLQVEHVSPAKLMRQEISRRKRLSDEIGEYQIADFRKWFWARKPDAGFFLSEFPATLLQAKVFDEWLDARNEALDAVIVSANAEAVLVEYYCNQGLLNGAD